MLPRHMWTVVLSSRVRLTGSASGRLASLFMCAQSKSSAVCTQALPAYTFVQEYCSHVFTSDQYVYMSSIRVRRGDALAVA